MNTILLMKLACLLGFLTILFAGVSRDFQKQAAAVGPATSTEKRMVTAKMTGWGDTFAKQR